MKKLTSYDYCSVAVILATIVLLIHRNDIFPIFVDIYYHLSVMEMFVQAGGVVAQDFLQFAPVGRPHLYPPMLHICMLALDYAGMSAHTIGKLVSAVMYPATLASVWYVVREHYSHKGAMFSVLLLASGFQFFNSTSIVSASALATIFALWTYHMILKGRIYASSVLFAFCLYSHLSYPHLIALSLVVWAAADAKHRKDILKVVCCSYILALPWLAHVALNMSSLDSAKFAATSSASVQLLSLVAAILGCVACLKHYKNGGKRFIIPVAMLLSMVPIGISYPSRLITHAAVPLSMVGGIGMGYILTRSARFGHHRRVAAYAGVAVFACVILLGNVTYTHVPQAAGNTNYPAMFEKNADLAPGTGTYEDGIYNPVGQTDKYQSMDTRPRIDERSPSPFEWDSSTLVSLIRHNYRFMTSRVQADDELIDAVLEHTSSEDILLVPQGTNGAFVSAYTGRATSGGMFFEVRPETILTPMELHQYDSYTFSVNGTTYIVLEGDQKRIPDPVVPSAVCLALLAAGIAVIVADVLRNQEGGTSRK